jgi:hypothetical protein
MQLFRERTMQPRRAILRDLMREGRARGEVADDADIDAAVDLFMGAYHAHHLSGEPFPERWEERIVDAILRGLGASPGR